MAKLIAISKADDGSGFDRDESKWINAVLLPVWLAAGAVAFLPIAFGTSPWDAVTLNVPGNQGNWWHFLAGAPCFLAFPMIWLRLRGLFSRRPSTETGRRILWSVAGVSVAGTILVETPFLLHLAGTSQWQRFVVLGVGFGIMIASGVILLLRRERISPTRGCIAALDAAYLANLSLVLVVYSDAAGSFSTRSGWFVAMVIVWPITAELVALLAQAVGVLAAA